MVTFNLIVLRSPNPSVLTQFYSGLGIRFEREKHASGPEHHAANLGGVIFEIYPSPDKGDTTAATRIGFEVPNVALAVSHATRLGAHIITPARTLGGITRAVIRDPDGHKVELTERPFQPSDASMPTNDSAS